MLDPNMIPDEIRTAAKRLSQWALESGIRNWSIYGIGPVQDTTSMPGNPHPWRFNLNRPVSPPVPPTIRASDFIRDVTMWLEDCVVKRKLTDEEKHALGIKFRFHSEKPLSDAEIARWAEGLNPPFDSCHECGGKGAVDSGGMTPWGSGIDIECPSCSNKS